MDADGEVGCAAPDESAAWERFDATPSELWDFFWVCSQGSRCAPTLG